ncbi:MAG: NUDIX domain-containing protein [Chlamydiota bacterium]|nr:NUDIX domain-containing protein [Chlamydiota bacterium]
MKGSSVVSVVYSKDKSKVIALKRCDVPVWVFPGGGVENNESPEEAIIREVKEETGVSVQIIRKVGIYSPVNRLTNTTHLFECLAVDGDLLTGEETREIGYYPIDDLPPPFLHVHKYWLEDSLSNSSELIEEPVRGATYLHFILFLFVHPILMFRYILTLLGCTINTSNR